MKNIILLIALIYILIKTGQVKANEILDACNRTYDEYLVDVDNNVVCANPNYNKTGRPAKSYFVDDKTTTLSTIDITPEQFLQDYKRSN
jgi:hypothetical protein